MPPTSQLPVFVSIIALVIAFLAFLVSLFNYRLDVRRRRDELFDRRYEFYRRLRTMWLRTGAGPGDIPEATPYDTVDLIPLADEAGFLFGKDMVAHIFSLEGKSHSGLPLFPDEPFVAPFRKYLALGP